MLFLRYPTFTMTGITRPQRGEKPWNKGFHAWFALSFIHSLNRWCEGPHKEFDPQSGQFKGALSWWH